jgi:pyridoxamine 5'-phosphate oxidase family protein
MSFTDAEIAYLRSQPLARLASVGSKGQPDVVPVALEYEGPHLWIGGVGSEFLETRKVRNIRAGRRMIAVVADDMPSIDPFIARGIRIYARAEDPIERVGMMGPGFYVRIVPTVSWSWNLSGEPAGETWYEMHRTVHSA